MTADKIPVGLSRANNNAFFNLELHSSNLMKLNKTAVKLFFDNFILKLKLNALPPSALKAG
jgi:hypothetical protein